MVDSYYSKPRLVSFYNQARIIASLGRDVKCILEVGIHKSMLSKLLIPGKYEITTADINPDLNPDILFDLTSDFDLPKDKFDAIALFQVLEHIPYEAFEKALVKLADTTKKFLIISLPFRSEALGLHFRPTFPNMRHRDLVLQVPNFWSSTPSCDEHYWEIGLKGYPKRRIINSFKRAGLVVKRQFQDPYNPYHYFFVLHK